MNEWCGKVMATNEEKYKDEDNERGNTAVRLMI